MKTYFVDAFTNQRFKGNPAAVCRYHPARSANDEASVVRNPTVDKLLSLVEN